MGLYSKSVSVRGCRSDERLRVAFTFCGVLMRISVFGLGYVGAVSVACLARDGHEVVGVDVDEHKLNLIKDGVAPILEDGIQELTEAAVKSGRFSVTNEAVGAVERSEVSFVCVGTPSRPNGGTDTSAVLSVATQIGSALRSVDHFHVVVVRSTVPPGTVSSEVRRLLEENSGKRCGQGFGLCFQPEFLREGSSIKDYDNPPFTVVGTDSTRAAKALQDIFAHLPGDFVVTDIGSAEMLKYACNSFHALKVTFANEIGRLSQSVGVDARQVMDLLCRDTSLNISPAYLRPGFAFGGSCLPKDLRSLLYMAKTADMDVPMLRSLLPSNRAHVDHAIDYVTRTGAKSVGLIGLSFKSGTDDLRESPLVTMAEYFIGKGFDLGIHDPRVSLSQLIGANRRFIEETIPHIAALMKDRCEDLLEAAQVIIIGLADPDLLECLSKGLREDHFVLDLVGIPDGAKLGARYRGVCW